MVDRIANDQTGVSRVEDDGEVVEPFDVPVDRLPVLVQASGAVLAVTVEDGAFVTADYHPDEPEARRDSMGIRLDRLSKRLSDRE